MPRSTPLIWHYTTRDPHGLGILADGAIRPSAPGGLQTERPAVLFSAAQGWDPSASKAVPAREEMGELARTGRYTPEKARFLSFDEQHQMTGCMRFGIPLSTPGLLDWETFKRRQLDTPRAYWRALEASVREVGARPALWFATFEPVPTHMWCAVELWDGRHWRAITGADLAAAPRYELVELPQPGARPINEVRRIG